MMRLHLLTCLMVLAQAIGLASSTPTTPNTHSNKAAALTLNIDSIHHINCLRATGYLEVVAAGGVQPYTYAWSNGNSGTLATNLAAGPYQVTVTDDMGATDVLSVTITEDLVLPSADAGANFTAVCANSVVSLSGSGSVGPEFQYLWTVANGGIIQSGATTLSPVIRHVGDFTLKVTNITNGCTATATVIVDAQHEPPAVTATGGVFTCVQPVTLNSTYPVLNTVFVWNGPSGYVSHLLNPQVSIVGTFTFKVTDTITTCLNTANAVVTADTVKPTALPNSGVLNCFQPSLSITGTYAPVGATFSWSGPNGFTSTFQSPLVNTPGLYRVTVTNPANGCTKSNSTTITSNFTPPTANASVNGTITCTIIAVQLFGSGTPAGITYAWTGPAGYTSTQQNPLVTVPGSYTLTTQNPANGCTAIAFVMAPSNTTPPGVTATGGLRTCANPTVTLMSSSNTQGVAYRWTGPNNYLSNLQNPVVTIAGTYTVTATNPVNGCTSTATAVVTQNTTIPNLTATTATISCYIPDPHIAANSTTSGVTFAWAGPNGFTANISSPIVTVGGTYTVTATNPVNGCTNTRSIFVDENLATPLVYAGEDRNLNCNFTSILANPIGTSTGSNITYLWTTFDGNIVSGETILYARFDAVGTYTLTVKNTQSGCTVQDSMNVYLINSMTVSATLLNTVSCFGGSNGSIKATIDGGSTPFDYIWSNGSQSATVNNLSIGTYTVTVTDSEGCTSTSSVTVTQPTALVVNASSTNQTQVGVNNGSATVSPSGGTGPYSVLWSTGSTFLTIINLAPGAYTVTITDNQGCTQSSTVNVNPVTCSITGNVTATDLNCAGVASGTATANISSAPTPITYIWSNGATTKTASNLAAGNYSVTATGSNGCSVVLSTQITGPQPLLLSIVSNNSVSCSGSLNGAAGMNATGGIAPYTYLWSSGSTSASISGLAVGTYTCTATDANTCTTVQTVQITGPQPVVLAVSAKTDVACVDSQTGSITMNATGGTAPFNYMWSNTASGPTISNLGVGNYICTVTDANGCSKNLNAQIVATDNIPPQLILKNASIALSGSGTASITPDMFDNGSFDQSCNIVNWTVSPTSFNCSNLGANTVTLTATDKNGNSASGNAVLTVIDDIAPTLTCPNNQTAIACASTVTFNAPQVQDNCAGGQATQTSGLPSGANFPVGITQQQYTFTDAGGNTAMCQFTVTISGGLDAQISTLPTSCSGSCDGSAVLSITGGGVGATVAWSNGQSGLNATGLCPGTYFATITDGAGCSQNFSADVLVQDLQAPTLTCPNDLSVGYCNTSVTFDAPQISDNCSINLQQLQLISGLPSGSSFPIGLTTQTFRYTDGGGNVGECSFNVTVHLAASVNSSATHLSCAGVCTGSATISVSGGQGPFGILWSNGSAGPVAANLCAGSYVATVTDADGCQQMQTVQVSEPAPLMMSNSNPVNDHANMGVGSIIINMSGGTMPYTYAWSHDGVPFATTQHIFGLFMGEYVVSVTDAKGCVFISNPFVITSTVGTDDIGKNFKWALYPNPAQSEVFIKMDDAGTRDAHLSVYDASGRLLLDTDLYDAGDEPVRVDLSGMPEGVLLLRLNTEKGYFSKLLVKGDQR